MRRNIILLACLFLLAGSFSAKAEAKQPAPGTFQPTGSMSVARALPMSVRLRDGTVLVAGGYPAENSADVYDPTTGTFHPVGNMSSGRFLGTATLLPDGKVLVAGGLFLDSNTRLQTLNTAELYDPETQTFAATEAMSVPRAQHTATLLTNGLVLITGGLNCADGHLQVTRFLTCNSFTVQQSAELYDPSTGAFAEAPMMEVPRFAHSATPLANGKVLIAGGYQGAEACPNCGVLDSAELFDPKKARFVSVGSMAEPHALHAAIRQPNGPVLIIGGAANNCNPSGCNITPETDQYNIPSRKFKTTGDTLAALRNLMAVGVCRNRVLVLGQTCIQGVCAFDNNTATELYSGHKFSPGADTSIDRTWGTAVALQDGSVLLAGAFTTGFPADATAERYFPSCGH